MQPRVLFSSELPAAEHAAWEAALRAASPDWQWLDREAARRAPASVSAAVVANPAPGSLQGLPALRLIQSLWAGVDRLLGDSSLPPGVPLARMVDPMMTRAMAETALWAVLALHRGFFAYARRQAERRWQQHAQTRAEDTPVLVLGFGEMGRAAAEAIAAMGYPVRAWRLRAGEAVEGGIPVSGGEAALAGRLAGAAIVVNLLPLTAATRGLVDARLLAALPPKAGFVNLARGAHVVEADLLAALDSGRLRHAVLDVFGQEPLPPEHRFWSHPRVTLLPHAAALTDRRSAAAVVASNLRALRQGGSLQHLVNPRLGY